MDFLNKLKLESKILAHAQNLLDIETASDTRQRADVWKLLSSTLNSSAERIASIDPLLHKLEPER
jgi:hypothetical protein